MKKYVKPIMESEEFVANEYVGACYLVTTEHCGSFVVKNEPNFDTWTSPDSSDGFYQAVISGTSNVSNVYDRSFIDVYTNLEKEPEHRILFSSAKVHIIKEYVETNKNNYSKHPNFS